MQPANKSQQYCWEVAKCRIISVPKLTEIINSYKRVDYWSTLSLYTEVLSIKPKT